MVDFIQWCCRWKELGSYQGERLLDCDSRLQALLEHWHSPIPGSWKRGADKQLSRSRYRRRDSANPRPGEHKIEHQILLEFFPEVTVLGGKLVDGINAMPLAKNE